MLQDKCRFGGIGYSKYHIDMNLVWCSPVTNGDHCYKNHSCFLFKSLLIIVGLTFLSWSNLVSPVAISSSTSKDKSL